MTMTITTMTMMVTMMRCRCRCDSSQRPYARSFRDLTASNKAGLTISLGRPQLSYDSGVLATSRGNAEYVERGNTAIKHEDGPFYHAGKMSYHCPICNAGYTYKKTLKTHMKYDCGKEPRFKCPYCNKRDKCSSNIYKHIRMRHNGMPVMVHRN